MNGETNDHASTVIPSNPDFAVLCVDLRDVKTYRIVA
jgi:hypothetical protein